MKVFDKSQFFKELNLDKLSEAKKETIWAKFLELVSLEVLDNILDELSEDEQEKLFLNLAKNQKNVVAFLQKNPNVSKFTPQALSKMKKEVLKNFLKK